MFRRHLIHRQQEHSVKIYVHRLIDGANDSLLASSKIPTHDNFTLLVTTFTIHNYRTINNARKRAINCYLRTRR